MKTGNKTLEDDKGFKQAFWKWFDSLPKVEKKRFWYYKVDMATTYFYNAIYTKQMR
jgi:hypothetical protein